MVGLWLHSLAGVESTAQCCALCVCNAKVTNFFFELQLDSGCTRYKSCILRDRWSKFRGRLLTRFLLHDHSQSLINRGKILGWMEERTWWKSARRPIRRKPFLPVQGRQPFHQNAEESWVPSHPKWRAAFGKNHALIDHADESHGNLVQVGTAGLLLAIKTLKMVPVWLE